MLDESRSIEKVVSMSSRRPVLLFPLIQEVLTEKAYEYRGKLAQEIPLFWNTERRDLFCLAEESSLKRILSNLINNSIESFGKNEVGRNIKVELRVTSNGANIFVQIIDQGRGIPPDILPKLMQKGASFGKEKGSGLGLYHAKVEVENWGGEIRIDSELGKGTIVHVTLLQTTAPKWFADKIRIGAFEKIVIVDDDPSIHGLWDKRFGSGIPVASSSREISARIFHLYPPEDLANWLTRQSHSSTLFLIDHEFTGSSENGLILIPPNFVSTWLPFSTALP